MIPKPLDKIEATDIFSLVDNHVDERKTLDFKRELPGKTERDKVEFCGDATSFANVSGGDIIFGMDESEGVATSIIGLAGLNADAEIRRLEQTLQSNIDPRIPGVESQVILIPEKNPILIVRIPKSWGGPHLVKINNDSFRMYGRNSKGKYPFDSAEIRSAFVSAAQLPERIRKWQNDRLVKIIGGETPVALKDGAKLIVHVAPFASWNQVFSLEIEDLTRNLITPLDTRGCNKRINLDGIVTYAGYSREKFDPQLAYCQVFRNGCIETVTSDIVNRDDQHSYIASIAYEENLIEFFSQCLPILKILGVPLPLVILGAIAGAKGAAMYVRGPGFQEPVIDRDLLVLPDILVESYDQDTTQMLRPLFDSIWNSCGYERSFNYDKDGNWNPKR